MRAPAALLIAVHLVGCARAESSGRAKPTRAASDATVLQAPSSAAQAGTTPAAPAAEAGAGLPFIDDDFPRALAQAKTQRKALFVDAWAQWCHTCLSMQHYVLNQPALLPLADRVVFAAIDTERESNAGFLARHEVSVWPTFFLIDPESERVLGYWPGSASLGEMRAFLENGLESMDALREGKLAPDSPLALLLSAKAAQAHGQDARAAELYLRVVNEAPPDFRRRNEALSGAVESLFRLGRAKPCVEFGLRHLREISGAARPVDYAALVFECTQGLPPGERKKARLVLVERLRELSDEPSPEMSPDDQADALHRLADALRDLGDRDGARAAHERRLAVMERAAKSAPSPEAAATYDYGRASAYLALGRAEDAVRMLAEREKQLPSSYEPPARLASILAELKRWPEAQAAIERALEHAYGPRRLRYLALKARIHDARGDRRAVVATLEEEVRGHRALGRQSADPAVKDAEKRLDEAQKKLR